MGINTVAVLYNDMTGFIERDGPMGKRMAYAMTAGWSLRTRTRLATDFGVGKVISQAHADYDQVVVVGQNTGCMIQEANGLSWMALDNMADCLKRHGWTVKPPSRRSRKPKPTDDGSADQPGSPS